MSDMDAMDSGQSSQAKDSEKSENDLFRLERILARVEVSRWITRADVVSRRFLVTPSNCGKMSTVWYSIAQASTADALLMIIGRSQPAASAFRG